MDWSDVPQALNNYDSMTYADNTNGTTAGQKLVRSFTNGSDDLNAVPVDRREEFMEQLVYRMGACENLVNSRAWRPKPGVWP